jgi:hypothetical protein
MAPIRVTLLIAMSCAWAAPAWADRLELRDGRIVEGRVLSMGDTRLAFDGPEGEVILERSAIARAVDDAGLEIQPSGEADPVAVVKVVGIGVTVRRLGQDLPLSVHGERLVREGDLVRTLPQGRTTLIVAGGGVVSARSDALVRFQQGLPELLEGVLTLEHPDGLVRARAPEGLVEVREGNAVLERLGEQTHLRCLAGRAELRAHDGYRVVLPRNHALTVQAGGDERLGTLSASNANAWPLRLESQGRFVSVQPGERIVLLSNTAPPEVELPAEPPPEALVERPQPAPSEPEPEEAVVGSTEPPSEAGRVVRATASFALERVGQASRQVDQAEAQGLTLWQDDRLATQRGQVELEVGSTRLRLFAQSELHVARRGGGAPFALDGEATLETSGVEAVALPMGEVGLVRGALAVRASQAETELSVRQGTAGLWLGDAVRVELLPGASVRATGTAERIDLEAPRGGPSLAVSLGTFDIQLEAGRRVGYGVTAGVQRIGLWNQALVELVGTVRLSVVPGASESHYLTLTDGRHFLLVPEGLYRFVQEGDAVRVVELPEGVTARDEPASQPETAPAPESDDLVRGGDDEAVDREPADSEPAQPQVTVSPLPAAPGTRRLALPNGAVLVTRDWGEVQVGRQAEGRVEVSLPGGRVWLAAKSELWLSRAGRGLRLETPDGRYLIHEPSGDRFELFLESDRTLRIEVGTGASRRAVQVEPDCEFDLLIRRSYARAFVFGQVKYVEPGELVRVGQSTGLRSHMARDRSER